MLCPECRGRLDDSSTCPSGHHFPVDNGVLRLLSDELRDKLARHEPMLSDYRRRAGHQVLDPSLLPRLPHALSDSDPEWRARLVDLRRVRKLVAGQRGQRVLEVGPYNGWLTHHLARDGRQVTAVDVFGDAVDGLATRTQHIEPTWRSVQMDLFDLSLLEQTFDVVVLNRCLAFAPDPAAWARHCLSRVRPGGLMIATGLAIFADPSRKEAFWRRLDADFRERYGAPFFWLNSTRGLLDLDDLRHLERDGMAFRREWRLWRPNLRSMLQAHAPRMGTGVWRA